MQARDIMTTDVETVAPETDVAELLKRLARADFNGFPVTDDDGAVVGIVTQTDVTRLFQVEDKTLWIPVGFPPFVDTLTYAIDVPWEDIDLGLDAIRNADKPVSEIMTTDLVTVDPDATIDRVLDLLATEARNVNRLPVVDADGRLAGIIARQDVIDAFRAERNGI